MYMIYLNFLLFNCITLFVNLSIFNLSEFLSTFFMILIKYFSPLLVNTVYLFYIFFIL